MATSRTIVEDKKPNSSEGVKKTLSSMLVCRLYRSASDSYGGDAGLLEIDFHYEIDSDGSRQEYTK